MTKGKGQQALLRNHAPALIVSLLLVLVVIDRTNNFGTSLVSVPSPSGSQFEDPRLNQIYKQALRESLRDSTEISQGFEWKNLKTSSSRSPQTGDDKQSKQEATSQAAPSTVPPKLEASTVREEKGNEDERLSSDQARNDLRSFFKQMDISDRDAQPHREVEVRKQPAVKGLSASTKNELQALMEDKHRAKLEKQVKQQKHDIRILEHMLVDSLAQKSPSGQQIAPVGQAEPVKEKKNKESVAEKAFANILAAAAVSELSHAANEKSSQSRPTRSKVHGYMEANEGGSQLASLSLPAPAAKCPPCGFLPNCQVNPAAVGRSRATGMYSAYPSMPNSKPVWGSGGAHLSTLAMSGGINQDTQPLWNKLGELFRPAGRKLLSKEPVAEDEGGSARVEELASFALPAPPMASPPPKCVCPACKLGDERLGFEDEKHSKSSVPQEDLVGLIDDELMKLDPQYAEKRMQLDGSRDSLVTSTQGWWPAGRANPFSDFSGTQQPFENEVVKKRPTVW
uniref:Uncharacterized protein n=1 Tax=Hanusia phi TaxID=3032 RepID=A0A7S0I0F3_9CRYP|mmetsp:Transcript_7459/g.16989  ORF Transcript_7459/g.16989 Transcript_7459/m.16989 type:complete len:510 (+) Transcript_7459:43-1572(+)